MAILPIVLEGDPRLRRKAAKIRTVDQRLHQIAADMFETMLEAPGVGLAGPQVGVMERIIVVSVPGDYIADDAEDVDMVLLNPEIVRADGDEIGTEGCLSIPGIIADVPRYTKITVKAMSLEGKHIRFKAEDWVARVLQHEIDHLDGILFLDRVVDKTTIRPASDPSNDDEDEDDTLAILTGDEGARS
jgi:peptide deformylase